jgi:predicted transcriptional regulator of viral defense system
MNWITFRAKLCETVCFSPNQACAALPGFDRGNLVRWTAKGYLVRLRNGLYTFAEHAGEPATAECLASRIYSPSYISLHYALASFGLIPEAVTQLTSVTTRKTARFRNRCGEYAYHSVSEDLFFGFELRQGPGGLSIPFATAGKALCDLLYLYPSLNTAEEIKNLRLDDDALRETCSAASLEACATAFDCAALEKRVALLLKTTGLP